MQESSTIQIRILLNKKCSNKIKVLQSLAFLLMRIRLPGFKIPETKYVTNQTPEKTRAFINPKGGRSPRFSGEDGIRTRDTFAGITRFAGGRKRRDSISYSARLHLPELRWSLKKKSPHWKTILKSPIFTMLTALS